MFAKIYAGMWTGFLLAMLIVFATGNLTMMAAVIAGFISFGLVFMGMMCVLPSTVGHHAEPAAKKAPKMGPSLADRARATVKDLVSPDGIEVRKPHFP